MEPFKNDKIKNPSFREEAKNVFLDWMAVSTGHGLPSIFRVKSVLLKVIWLLCFLVSFGYCTYSVTKSFINFFQYPSTISTTIIQEIPTKFPAVTICNYKSVNYSAAKKYLSNYMNYPNGSEFMDPKFFYEIPLDYSLTQMYNEKLYVINNKNLTDQERKSLGYDLSNMLISCRLSYQKCNESDFTYFFHPFYGNCYTFNKASDDSIKKVSVTGPDFGLILELLVSNPAIDTHYYDADGIVVAIHNQSFTPTMTSDRILVSVGTSTDISIKRTFIHSLDDPYGDCLMDCTSSSKFSSTLFDFVVRQSGIYYSQKICFNFCVQKKIIETCGCAIIILPLMDTSTQTCSSLEQLYCGINVMYNFANFSKECQDACPRECDTVEYDTSTSSLLYPSIYYKDTLLVNNSKIKGAGIPYSDIDKAVLRLNVFYESVDYVYIEQQIQQTKEDFVSNLGGTLGLYMGISLLSMVEIVEIIIVLIQKYVEYNKDQNRIKDSRSTMVFNMSSVNASETQPENDNMKIELINL